MTTWDQTWKDIDITIPALLPLGAVPQQPDPGEMLQYIQGLHNYLASDRQSLVRALNVLGRFRMLQTDNLTDAAVVASGSGALKVQTDTGMAYYDAISQEAVSGAEWKPLVLGSAADMHEPTGFVDTNADTNIGITGTDFYIEPSGTEFSFYINGVKFTKTAQETLDISSATSEGSYWIYYDDTGELVLDDAAIITDFIRDNAFVAQLYHDGTTMQFLMDERHGLMPWETHLWLHLQEGTVHRTGMGLSGMSVNGNGNTDAHAEVDWVAGTIMDEDITHIFSSKGAATWHTLYLGTGAWHFDDLSLDAPVFLDTGVPQYNDVSTPGSETLEDVTNNKFFLMHIFATNIHAEGDGTAVGGYVAIVGQNEYNKKRKAREGANTEISNIITTGLPMPEFLPVGTVIYQRKGSNAYNCAVVSTDEGDDYVSWLGAEIQPGSPPSSHANLTHRDDVNQHPATAISADVTNFAGVLSASDDEVQVALDTLDDHTHDGRYYTESEVDTFLALYLPLTAGSSKSLTGNLYLETATNPTAYWRKGGDTDDYGSILHNGYNGGFPAFKIAAYGSSGAAPAIYLDCIPADGSSNGYVSIARTTNTTGGSGLLIYQGDGSGTAAHQFFGSGMAKLDLQGNTTVTIGNILDVNGRVRLPYLGAAPASLVNGDMWMESDGLHIYYAGAEKTVAGV